MREDHHLEPPPSAPLSTKPRTPISPLRGERNREDKPCVLQKRGSIRFQKEGMRKGEVLLLDYSVSGVARPSEWGNVSRWRDRGALLRDAKNRSG